MTFELFKHRRMAAMAAAEEAGAAAAEQPSEPAEESTGEGGGEQPTTDKTAAESLYPDQGEGQGEQAANEDGGAEQPGERPEYVPEDLWDAENGQPKVEDAMKELAELRAERAERESANENAPESPDGYQLNVPEDVEMPEGITFEFDPNDPLAQVGRQIAHEMGLDQKGFEQKLLKPYVEQRLQEHQSETERAQQEIAQLGDNAQERIDQANRFLDKHLPKAQAEALRASASTADGVKAIEALMKRANGPRTTGEQQPPQRQDRPAHEVLFGGTTG